jgi:anaerobic selenocysteine-containing dehydrogenase
VVVSFRGFRGEIRQPGGFTLPHGPRDALTFATRSGRASFTVNPMEIIEVPPGRLLLQTLRSHDQYNTTIYGLDDRYRGVHGGRRVVFVHPDDLAALGVADLDIDIAPSGPDGRSGAPGFRAVAYPTKAARRLLPRRTCWSRRLTAEDRRPRPLQIILG